MTFSHDVTNPVFSILIKYCSVVVISHYSQDYSLLPDTENLKTKIKLVKSRPENLNHYRIQGIEEPKFTNPVYVHYE